MSRRVARVMDIGILPAFVPDWALSVATRAFNVRMSSSVGTPVRIRSRMDMNCWSAWRYTFFSSMGTICDILNALALKKNGLG